MLQKSPHSIPATRRARVRSLARTTRARGIHIHISAAARPHTRVSCPFAIAVARTPARSRVDSRPVNARVR